MNHKSEADILKEHGELTTEVSRLKGELETAKTAASSATDEVAKLKGELETIKATAAKVPGLEAKIQELEAKDMDAEKRAAAIVAKVGIRGDSTKPNAKDEPKLTISQQCLKARGVEVNPNEPVTLIL